jgi:hypothetical protein
MHAPTAPAPIDPLHDIDLKDGKFSGVTTAQDLSKAFDNFERHCPSRHLCVFFHGGLVPRADGLKTASQLIGDYGRSGAPPRERLGAFLLR